MNVTLLDSSARARFWPSASMSGSGSMATTSATNGAASSASWPGPAPRSSTRSARVQPR